MIGAILAGAKALALWGWAWVVPWAGPLAEKALPWLGFVPGLGALKRWALVATYVAALGVGVWGGVKVHGWWTGDMITQEQATAEARAATEAALARTALAAERARLDAERRALADQQAAIAAREAAVRALEIQQQQFEDALTGERNASAQTDDVPVLDADDGWLRAWRRRGR